MKQYFPILDWLPNYQKSHLKGDISAGLTIGVMLVPQGMAYAMLAGLPPIYGLYAAITPQIFYAFLGTSRQLAVGPVALDSLLVASGVGLMAEAGSEQYISLVILLGLLVGFIQFIFGLFRLGFIVNFLSKPVISGFTSAAAIIIAISQLKYLLGIQLGKSNSIIDLLLQIVTSFSSYHFNTIVFGLIAISILILIKKYKKEIPGPLVVVLLSIAIVYFFQLDAIGIQIVKDVPAGLPVFSVPLLEIESIEKLLPIALTIALVGFMEATAVGKALQSRHKEYAIRPNQELLALGLGNFIGAFFKSFPSTGGFSRSAVNDESGANTNLAALISAALIALTLLFLTSLFYYLPLAILAAIILVSIYGLVDLKQAIYLWKTDRRDFYMLVATFIATLTFGIIQGIGMGVILSLGMVIYRSAYPHMASLGNLEGTTYYRNVKRFPHVIQRKDILIVRFDAQMYFANFSYFKEKMLELEVAKGGDLKLVILSASSIHELDSTAVYYLREMINEYKVRGIRFYISSAIGPVRDVIFKSGLINELGKNALFLHICDAIQHFDGIIGRNNQAALQTNTEND